MNFEDWDARAKRIVEMLIARPLVSATLFIAGFVALIASVTWGEYSDPRSA
jgi:hypothetical protein